MFDERGQRYVVPGWTVGWPGALRRSMPGGEKTSGETEEGDDGGEMIEDEVEDDEVGILGPREKGKQRDTGHAGNEMKIKVRLSSTGRDLIVKVGEDDPVSVVIRRIRDAADVRFYTAQRSTELMCTDISFYHDQTGLSWANATRE